MAKVPLEFLSTFWSFGLCEQYCFKNYICIHFVYFICTYKIHKFPPNIRHIVVVRAVGDTALVSPWKTRRQRGAGFLESGDVQSPCLVTTGFVRRLTCYARR